MVGILDGKPPAFVTRLRSAQTAMQVCRSAYSLSNSVGVADCLMMAVCAGDWVVNGRHSTGTPP